MQQYTYIDVIFLGSLFSFIGIVISIITRKTRKIHPALWISGIISCMLGFIVCMFVFSMLIGGLICGLGEWIIDKEHKGTEDDPKHFPWDKFGNRE